MTKFCTAFLSKLWTRKTNYSTQRFIELLATRVTRACCESNHTIFILKLASLWLISVWSSENSSLYSFPIFFWVSLAVQLRSDRIIVFKCLFSFRLEVSDLRYFQWFTSVFMKKFQRASHPAFISIFFCMLKILNVTY